MLMSDFSYSYTYFALCCLFALQGRLLVAEDTTLTDLLGRQLHKAEDEVQSMVDNAVKELGTEKVRDAHFFFCFCRIVCNKLLD